jgi:hypothetical protein
MPISTTDQLFNLVKGLTKSEKRNFKLYAKRTQQVGEAKFIRLFDIIDNMDEYDEDQIFTRVKGLSKSQLSNLKRHLYSQILSSLRLIHISRNIDIQIREQIDFARILYGKGLYMQSLKLLERIKGIAKSSNQDILHYEILEFEKLIEEKHITRSRTIKNKMEDLIDESEQRNRIISNSNKLTNLKLKIHGLYIQIGHIKNEKDAFVVQDYFKSNLPPLDYSSLTFFEKIYLHQSYVWYYYILLDFEKCEEHARKWVTLLESNPKMIEDDPDIYLRGLHYLLTSFFNQDKVDSFVDHIIKFERFERNFGDQLNMTSEIIFFLYYYSALVYKHYLQGTFDEGLKLVPELERKMSLYERNLDLHRILVFYYRIAWLNFGHGNYSAAIDYLNKIINLKVGHLREDIQSYARLMHLLAHFELRNFSLLEYLEKSVSRFFDKMKDRNKVQLELLSFIRKQLRSNNVPDEKLLRATKKNLIKLASDPYEKRAFLYLNALDWVESKLQGKTVAGIIRERRQPVVYDKLATNADAP